VAIQLPYQCIAWRHPWQPGKAQWHKGLASSQGTLIHWVGACGPVCNDEPGVGNLVTLV